MACAVPFYETEFLDDQGDSLYRPYPPHVCWSVRAGAGYFKHGRFLYQAFLDCDHPHQVNVHTRAERELCVLDDDGNGGSNWDVEQPPVKVETTSLPLQAVWGKYKDVWRSSVQDVADKLSFSHCAVSEVGGVTRLRAEAFPVGSSMHNCLCALREVVGDKEADYLLVMQDGTVQPPLFMPAPGSAVGVTKGPVDSMVSQLSECSLYWGSFGLALGR
jgi:hypothetical protein